MTRRGYKTIRLGLMFGALAISTGCSSPPVEEVITTDAARASAVATAPEPLAKEADLPKRNPDLEVAGDRIGEAITYLRSKRKDRRDRTITAINQAEIALNKVKANDSIAADDRAEVEQITTALGEIRRLVNRSSPDSYKALTDINKRLDRVELQAETSRTREEQ